MKRLAYATILLTSLFVAQLHAAPYAVDIDAWLKESSPSENNGNGTELSVKNASGDRMHAVLEYDLSSIPANSNITSAVAYFWVSGKDDSGDPINVHRITKNWNENSARWVNLASDFDPTVVGTFAPVNDDTWVSVDITSLVQDWVCGTYSNFGIMLQSTSNGNEAKLASSEWSPSSQRPYVDVTIGAGSGCGGPSPGHFAISHAGTNDTCTAADVTVSKHTAAHTVDSGYTGTISLSTSTGNGSWTLVTGAGALTDLGGGNASYTYAGGDAGVVVLGLSNSTDETLNINITDGSETEDASEDPDLTFSSGPASTFRDNFDVVSFANNDGSNVWTNSWQEIGESNGPLFGDIRVSFFLDVLFIKDDNRGLWREADLSAFTSATLSFDYRRQNFDNDNDYVAVEVFDGATWTELAQIGGAGSDGSPVSFSEDISAYIASNTRVRLVTSGSLGNADVLRVDNFEISASASACVSAATVGFALAHDGAGIHCLNEPVSITALDATMAPVTDYAGAVTLTTQSGRGTWTLASGSGAFADTTADDGIATYTFDPADAGVAGFSLSYPEGTSPIDVDVYQSDDVSIRDDDSEGLLNFAPTGFTLTANALGNPPSSPINDPLGPQLAGTDFALHITAYGVTDDDPLCGVIESYTGPRPLKFFMSYDNPGSGSRAATIDGSDTNTGTSQSVTFSAGQAQVAMKYKDAGLITISAQDDTSFINVISGASNSFVVKPAALVITRIENSAGDANPEASNLTDDPFTRAGDAFEVDVQARDAEGAATPNFGLETPAESVLVRSNNLVLPLGGRNGSTGDVLNGASFAPGASAGLFTNTNVVFDEVGIIQLRAEVGDGDYLGGGAVAGTLSNNVGRFYPASFVLTTDSVSPACTTYTYMDQPAIDLDYRLEARNSSGTITENYDEDLLGTTIVADIVHVAEAANDGTDLGSRLSAIVTEWQSGEVVVDQPDLTFARAVTLDGPFDPLQLGVRVIDSVDSVALAGMDMNPTTSGDCIAAANCDAHSVGAPTRVVYGRLLVLPGFGPETRDLDLGLVAQQYGSGAFSSHTADSCSSYASAQASLDPTSYTDNLDAGETSPIAPAASTLLINGAANPIAPLTLSAPGIGNEGSVLLLLDVPAWLEFDWLGTGAQDPTGKATFGRYRGHDRIIYRIEQ